MPPAKRRSKGKSESKSESENEVTFPGKQNSRSELIRQGHCVHMINTKSYFTVKIFSSVGEIWFPLVGSGGVESQQKLECFYLGSLINADSKWPIA